MLDECEVFMGDYDEGFDAGRDYGMKEALSIVLNVLRTAPKQMSRKELMQAVDREIDRSRG